MSNETIVYKVLSPGTGTEENTSRFAEGKARVIYKKGIWTQAPSWLRKNGYHLLAFTNLADAEEFAIEAYDDKGGIICEAIARCISHNFPVRCERTDLARGNFIPKKWDKIWAQGSVMCEEIMITKVLKILTKGYYNT